MASLNHDTNPLRVNRVLNVLGDVRGQALLDLQTPRVVVHDPRELAEAKDALLKAGVKKEQIEGTLGGMLRVVHQAKEQGEKFELNPRVRRYFLEELKLTEKQVELAVGLSRRLAHSAKRGTKQY